MKEVPSSKTAQHIDWPVAYAVFLRPLKYMHDTTASFHALCPWPCTGILPPTVCVNSLKTHPHAWYIQSVSTTLAQTSGVSSPHQNKKKSSYQYIYICPQTLNFRGTASTFALVIVMINAQYCFQKPIESSQLVSLSIIRARCHTTKAPRTTQIK
jgi:hypothetical protein